MLRPPLIALLGVLLCWGLCSARPVQARDRLSPPDTEDFRRWGPLRVRPGFAVSNFGWDDNIFSNNRRKVGDFTATVTPRLDGMVLLGNYAFSEFTARAGYVAYAENTDQNYWIRELDTKITVPFSRFGVFGEFDRSIDRERPADREDVRPRRDESAYGGGFIFKLGWRIDAQLGVYDNSLKYTDEDLNSAISNRLNRDELTTELDVRYRWIGRTRLLLTARTTEIKFDELIETPMGGFVNRDSDAWDATVGIDLGADGPLSGALRLGYSSINLIDPQVPDLEEWIGELDVRYRLDGFTRFELEGIRATGFAVFEAQTHFVRSDIDLRAIRFLNRTIGVELGTGIGTLSFPQSLPENRRFDDLTRYDVGLRLRGLRNALNQRLEFSLRVRRFERDSNVDIRDRTQTRVVLDVLFNR